MRRLIQDCDCGGWRQLMIENPETFKVCKQHTINRSDEKVCLLTRKTIWSYHAELKSYVLYCMLKVLKKDDQLPNCITDFEYQTKYGEDSPYIFIERPEHNFHLHNHLERGWYATTCDKEAGEEVEIDIPIEITNLYNRIDET